MVDRLNNGEVVAAPPKTVPPACRPATKLPRRCSRRCRQHGSTGFAACPGFAGCRSRSPILLALFLLLLGAPVLIGLVLIVAARAVANYLRRAVNDRHRGGHADRGRTHARSRRRAADEPRLPHRRAGLVAGTRPPAAATTRMRGVSSWRCAKPRAWKSPKAHPARSADGAADRRDRQRRCGGAEPGEDDPGVDAAARVDSGPHPAGARRPGTAR